MSPDKTSFIKISTIGFRSYKDLTTKGCFMVSDDFFHRWFSTHYNKNGGAPFYRFMYKGNTKMIAMFMAEMDEMMSLE